MKRFHLVLLLGTMLSLFSCTHKELCMEHPHMAPLRLEFDWRDAPSANRKTGASNPAKESIKTNLMKPTQ